MKGGRHQRKVPLNKTDRGKLCVYCWGPADDPGSVVPACLVCTGILGGRVFDSFEAQQDYVARRRWKKRERGKQKSKWTKAELEELGPTLRSFVENKT